MQVNRPQLTSRFYVHFSCITSPQFCLVVGVVEGESTGKETRRYYLLHVTALLKRHLPDATAKDGRRRKDRGQSEKKEELLYLSLPASKARQ